MDIEPDEEQIEEEPDDSDESPDVYDQEDDGEPEPDDDSADWVKLKELAGGRSPQEVLDLAREGQSALQRRQQEEERMFKEREEEQAKESQSADDDDLVSKKDVDRILAQRLTEERRAAQLDTLAGQYGLDQEQRFMAEAFVKEALADPKNRGATVADAYKYWVSKCMPPKKEPGQMSAKEKVQAAAARKRSRPPGAPGAGGPNSSISAPVSRDTDQGDTDEDIFDEDRLDRFREEEMREKYATG